MNKKYILAVPNFSEGRDQEKIEEIVASARNIDGVNLIKVEPEYDFNRTVVTLLGEAEALLDVLVNMSKKASELIDMEKHQGSHPRMGSMDIVPIYPFKNTDLEEVKDFARKYGERFHEESGVPIYFSGASAKKEERSQIYFIRKGQYEGLRELLEEEGHEDRRPDLSKDGRLSRKSGATIVYTMEEGPLAYNIYLGTENLEVARSISQALRGPSGGFKNIKSVAIKFKEHPGVVISMNIDRANETPLYRAFEFVKMEAKRYGVAVTGSEIVGPIGLDHIIDSLEYYLGLENFKKAQILENHLMD